MNILELNLLALGLTPMLTKMFLTPMLLLFFILNSFNNAKLHSVNQESSLHLKQYTAIKEWNPFVRVFH